MFGITTKSIKKVATTIKSGDGITPTKSGDGITPTKSGDGNTPTRSGNGLTPKKSGDEITTKTRGDEGERAAWDHLRSRGLVLVERNYRVAAGPRARGGEIDLIARDRDGTLVFIEVRSRVDARFGGAAGSISPAKRRSLVLAAQHFLRRFASPPPCRFDVVAIEGEHIEWLKAAFDAG